MLTSFYFRQTTRHLARSTLSTLPYPKSSETQINSPTNNHKIDSIDLLSQQHEKRSTITSAEKFADGVSSMQSNTLVLPGIPVTGNVPPLASEHQRSTTDDRIPSSRFSAFLRSIRSGLPFFPSTNPQASAMDVATTREHFLPLTRPSLIRLIATDQSLLNEDDRLLFHQLCEGIDSAVVQRYHPILNELKNLFNPINPDQETIEHRRLSQRDRLDNEYWLLQKIDDLLHRSNFTELPRNLLLEKFLLRQDSSTSSVNIQINGYDYDVLKFWILGREQMPMEELSRWKRLVRRTNPMKSTDYFKRVILAVRLKGQDRLYFKAFRDIPLQNLPQLLPVGTLQMGRHERQLIRLTLLVASSTAVTQLITTMANLNLPGLLVGGSSLTLLLALWAFRSAYRAKLDYLSTMNRLSFYKNIASNKQLLGMIIDRAEDELSKEILLAYVVTLWRQKQNVDLTTKMLELEVENWIRMKTNANISFNSEQSVEFLRKLGILLPQDLSKPGLIQVIPLKQVVAILPKISRTLSEKNEEWDLIEGYDKKYFEVDWKTVLYEDKLLKKGGWH